MHPKVERFISQLNRSTLAGVSTPVYKARLVQRLPSFCSNRFCMAQQGRTDGGYIGIYTPPKKKKSVYLKKIMWLFFSCDPGQIRYDVCSHMGH